jgi:hypothetical protein
MTPAVVQVILDGERAGAPEGRSGGKLGEWEASALERRRHVVQHAASMEQQASGGEASFIVWKF